MESIMGEDMQLLANQFISIAKKVHESDKMKAAVECFTSYMTIRRYLKGEIPRTRFDFAKNLYETLVRLTEERQASIDGGVSKL